MKYRTAIGNRCFSARVSRIWELLPDRLKFGDMRQKKVKEEIKKEIRTWDADWVLWGKDRSGLRNLEVYSAVVDVEEDETAENEDYDPPEVLQINNDSTAIERSNGEYDTPHQAMLILLELNEITVEKEEYKASLLEVNGKKSPEIEIEADEKILMQGIGEGCRTDGKDKTKPSCEEINDEEIVKSRIPSVVDKMRNYNQSKEKERRKEESERTVVREGIMNF